MVVVFQNLVFPVFLLLSFMIVGLFLGKAKQLGKAFNLGLSSLLLNVTLPCLILVSMQKPYSPLLADLGFIAIAVSFAFYIGLFTIVVLAFRMLPVPPDRVGVYRFVLLFSNVGFMGFPLVEALWGRDAVFLCALFNMSFNLFVFTIGVWVLTDGRSEKKLRRIEMVAHPGLWATIAGFAFFLASIQFPPFLLKTLDTLGGLTTPLSMILIGSVLSNSSLRTAFASRGIWVVSFARLIAIPLGVWCSFLALRFAGIDVAEEVRNIAILLSAMPAAANTTLLATKYQTREDLAGQAVFVTTAFSFVTVPLVVAATGIL